MFSSLNVGCVLMTPELRVREMNEFGARHSHVDPEAIRGTSILDIFVDLEGVPKQNFTKFMMLAQAGAVSEIVDLPHLCARRGRPDGQRLVECAHLADFRRDDHLLGLVEWAEPFTRPTTGGHTLLRIAPGSTA